MRLNRKYASRRPRGEYKEQDKKARRDIFEFATYQ